VTDDNHSDQDDQRFWARLAWILDHALGALDADDMAERLDYCKRTGNHGTHAADVPGEDAVLFSWGGRPLVKVPRDVFADEAYQEGLSLIRVPVVPDTPAALVGPGDDLDRFPDARELMAQMQRLDRVRLEMVARWIAHRLAGDLQ